MKNVFRLFGRFTMVMMIVGMVTLTSCEKEDVFDGKKPTEQVLGGGDEVGNPEDFYPYTDKIIVESTIESTSEEYINMETFSNNIYQDNKKNIRTLVFKKNKVITDTVNIDDFMWYRMKYTEFESMKNITVKVDLIFFKNNGIFKEHFKQGETQYEHITRLRGDSIKEIYDKI